MAAARAVPAYQTGPRARAIAGDPFRGTLVDAMRALAASIVVIFPIKPELTWKWVRANKSERATGTRFSCSSAAGRGVAQGARRNKSGDGG